MAGMKAVVEHVLKGHEPYPALAVDRHWNMVAANKAVALLTQLAAPELFEPPVNVLRVALHPKGLAPHIVNRGEWRAHLLERLDHQIDASADAGLIALRDELAGYGGRTDAHDGSEANGIAVPLILDTPIDRKSTRLNSSH